MPTRPYTAMQLGLAQDIALMAEVFSGIADADTSDEELADDLVLAGFRV